MMSILVMTSGAIATRLVAAGTQGSAVITTGGVTSTLEPNAEGVFPMVVMAANGNARVVVTCPSGGPGDKVALAAQDGGSVDGRVVQIARLNEKHEVTFNFSTTANEGLYRVAVRMPQCVETVQFWVGAEPQMKGQ